MKHIRLKLLNGRPKGDSVSKCIVSVPRLAAGPGKGDVCGARRVGMGHESDSVTMRLKTCDKEIDNAFNAAI